MAQNKVSAEDLADIETNARRVSADDLAFIESSAGGTPTPAPAPPEAQQTSTLGGLAGLSGQRGVSAAPELDAYIQSRAEAAQPKKTPDPGFLSSVGNSLASGFLKQGWDEYTGAVSRAKDVLPGATYQMPDGTVRPVGDNDDLYRASRDRVRQTLEGASEHHPVTSTVANMAGDIGSDVLLRSLGVPVTSSGYQAASGALSGLLGSDAELTSDKVTPKSAASAAASTALGGALGFYAPKVGEAMARRFPALAAKLREGLEDTAIQQGRRVLENVSTTLSNRLPTSDEAVREALERGAIRGFRTTRDAFEELEQLAAEHGATYGDILERLEKAGVQGPDVETIARELMDRANASRLNSGSDKSVARLYAREAANTRNVAPRDFALVGEAGAALPAPIPGPQRSSLTLGQAENIKRDLQEKARWDRIRTTGLDDARQDVSSIYRQRIEDAIAKAREAAPKGSEVAQLAEDFLPTKQTLARLIEAREAAERGTIAGAKRSKAGLTDYLAANAAAASGLGPFGAIMAGTANNILKGRGTSAVASGAYKASKAAGELGRWAATEPETARTLGQVGAGLMSRQFAGSDWLEKLVSTNPEALGEYGPVLASAMERGPSAMAAADYVLGQKDPQYRQKKEAAQKSASGQQ